MLHIYAKHEHDEIIEQSICIIKENARGTHHALPFKKYTRLMTRSLIEGGVDLLIRFPYNDRVSDTLTP